MKLKTKEPCKKTMPRSKNQCPQPQEYMYKNFFLLRKNAAVFVGGKLSSPMSKQ